MNVHETLEHNEHAGHAAEHGNKRAALIVAVLAACLALCEQQAKHAEIRVEDSAIGASDAWSQYQAKSIRQTLARDLSQLTLTLDAPQDPARVAKRTALIGQLQGDVTHYGADETSGKDAIAERAHGLEEKRDHAIHTVHSLDNAAAAFELGIVLATASVITSSVMLVRFAYVLGAAGLVFGILGLTVPQYVAF